MKRFKVFMALSMAVFLFSNSANGDCKQEGFSSDGCMTAVEQAPSLYEDNSSSIIKVKVTNGSTVEGLKYSTGGSIYFKPTQINSTAEISLNNNNNNFIPKTNYYIAVIDVVVGQRRICEYRCFVEIEAVNRYDPLFLGDALFAQKITVEENNFLTTPLKTFRVGDQDIGRSTKDMKNIHLSIKENEEKDFFEIKPAKISAKEGEVELFLKKALDFEARSLHVVTIVAEDESEKRPNPTPKRTKEITVFVDVKDVHDQPPQFVRECGLIKLEEQTPVNEIITTVKARDADIQVGNPVKYAILHDSSNHESDMAFKYFQVNKETGVLTVKESPDRESKDLEDLPSISFTIQATEYNRTTLEDEKINGTATTTCIIQIIDIDDNPAVFEINNISTSCLGGSNIYKVNVSENSPVNTVVAMDFNTVNDKDMGENAKYTLFLTQDEEVFVVSPENGMNMVTFFIRVYNSKALDYEREDLMNKAFNFKISSIGKLNKSHVCDSKIQINLLDENDNYPIFEQLEGNSNISENASAGDYVATVKATDVDTGDYGTRGIRYYIPKNPLSDSFQIDEVTGVITVKANHSLDRETMAEVYLPVEAVDNLGKGLRNFTQILITILDANDQKPYFTISKYKNVLFENDDHLQNPTEMQAFDRDEPNTPNSMINFKIIPNDFSAYFTINKSNGIIAPNGTLDFESLEFQHLSCSRQHASICVRIMTLEIRAYDLGIPTQYSDENATVTIEFTDVNDNTPIFKKEFHEENINETIPKGQFILQVEAADADISPAYNQVYYSFMESSDHFVVNRKDGNITVSRGARLAPEDNNNQKLYLLNVEATDGIYDNENQNLSVCQVTINVSDVNNVAPVFVKDKFNITKLPILEEQDTMMVAQFFAYDPDETNNLEFAIVYAKCTPEPPRPIAFWDPPDVNDYVLDDKFTIDKKKGILYVTRVDRERLEKITLNITVTDLNADPQFSNQVAVYMHKLEIIDINDNAPMFIANNNEIINITADIYEASVRENDVPDNLLQIRAIDIDGPGNNDVFFKLLLPDDTFWIHNKTGVLKMLTFVDYEEHHSMNFSVVAYDDGEPLSLTSPPALVNITIIDVNDNKPIFANDTTYEVNVWENATIGTFVMKVTATDLDSGPFGLVNYDFKRGTEDNFYFNIGKENGIITVKESLLSKDKIYVLKPIVRAFDNPGSSWDSFEETQIITINLNDTNKFPPKFVEQSDFISEHLYLVSELHKENVDFGLTVKAVDDDKPDTNNSKVEYFIVSGDTRDLFQVGKESGLVTPKTSLHKLFGIYDITFMAKDKGNPPLNSTKVFKIKIYDENDHRPVFKRPPSGTELIVAIPEGTQSEPIKGKFICYVLAEDEDDGENGTVSYDFARDTEDQRNNASFFRIYTFKNNGTITIIRDVTKEQYSQFTLTITAMDGGSPRLKSEPDAIVIVKLKSELDLLPYFEKKDATFNFTENTVDEIRIVPEASFRKDLDVGSAPICYFIIGGDMKLFHLNKETRQIRLRDGVQLDREEHAFHSVYVKAQTNCREEPPLLSGHLEKIPNDTVNITIGVTDVNDNAPKFDKKIYTGRMTTMKTSKNDHIVTVLATDRDEGINAVVEYAIYGDVHVEESENLDTVNLATAFTINNSTGAISLNFVLNNKMRGYFRFFVIATDIGCLNDTAEVLIYLMREDQQITVIILKKESTFTSQDKREFAKIFENILGHYCIADKWEPNEEEINSQESTKVWMHLVNEETNKILDPSAAETLVDNNWLALKKATDIKFPIDKIQKEKAEPLKNDEVLSLEQWKYVLLAVVAALALALFVTIATSIVKLTSMKRNLKAATATAFGSQDSGLNRIGVVSAPNTNQHTYEGSNPIWNQQDLKFPQQDYDSETASVGSLDIDMMNYPSENEGLDNPCFLNTEEVMTEKPPVIIKPETEIAENQTKSTGKRKKNKAPDVPSKDDKLYKKNAINTLRMAESNWRRRNTQGELQFDPNEMPQTHEQDFDKERRLSLFIQPQKSSEL